MKKLLFFGIFLSIGLTSFGQVAFDGGTGGTGTDWDTAENWSTDNVPTINDDIVIDGFTVVISTTTTAEAATVNIISGFISMEGNASLTVGTSPEKNNKVTQKDQDKTVTGFDSK